MDKSFNTVARVTFRYFSRIKAAVRNGIAGIACAALLIATTPFPLHAQDAAPADSSSSAGNQTYSAEQLDALLAPIALYPDALLTQVLMASVYPLQIVDASRWLETPANAALKGDALDSALTQQDWDPSVKSLIPFPQVLSMMNKNLDWTQQLGYAVTEQQSDVMASVQRLRQQAMAAGQLQTTEQQVVTTQGSTIIIQPAQPTVVYVPVYNPTVVYGAWPYAAYPPVYFPPPPGYVAGNALVAGLAFGAGVAITAGLWGWASPNWGHGNVNVNVNRYNSINVNRAQINNSAWRPNGRPPAGGYRPPAGGPVGRPGGPAGIPPNAIGRPSVNVPGNIARPPSGMGPGNRPPIGQGGNRPGNGSGATRPPGNQGGLNRPGNGAGGGQVKPPQGMNKPSTLPANRPSGGGASTRPATRASAGQGGGNRSPGAFSGMSDGNKASQFGNRGAQSRQGGGAKRAGGGGGGGAKRGGGGGGGGRRR